MTSLSLSFMICKVGYITPSLGHRVLSCGWDKVGQVVLLDNIGWFKEITCTEEFQDPTVSPRHPRSSQSTIWEPRDAGLISSGYWGPGRGSDFSKARQRCRVTARVTIRDVGFLDRLFAMCVPRQLLSVEPQESYQSLVAQGVRRLGSGNGLERHENYSELGCQWVALVRTENRIVVKAIVNHSFWLIW